MSRGYRHIKEYEKETLKLKEQRYTKKVTIGSPCYYLDISKNMYPKDHYLPGEDLLPFYKNNADQKQLKTENT